MRRARQLARRLAILATVIREPGLSPGQLAGRHQISERTLFRDMAGLRLAGYGISYSDGYQVQENLALDGISAPSALSLVYEQQLRLLRAGLPAGLAGRVEADIEVMAPAALASLFAAAIERRLGDRTRRPVSEGGNR